MKLSIITICYNEEKLIAETIQSVLGQTFKDYQFIIIDGASTDGSLDIIKKFKDKIDVFFSEPDNGIYNAMNKGLMYTKGEYVLFLNGGDYLHNNNVLKDVFSFGHKEDILHGYLKTQENKVVKKLINTDIQQYLRTNTLPHQATFVKKSVFNKTNGFDESFNIAGDYHFFVRAVLEYSVSTRYIPVLVTDFNLDGIAQNIPQIRDREKRTIQELAKELSHPHSLTYNYILKILTSTKKILSNQSKYQLIPNPPIFDTKGLFVFFPNSHSDQTFIAGGSDGSNRKAALSGRCIIKKIDSHKWSLIAKKKQQLAIKFTIVRHPYSRFLSSYRYLSRFYNYRSIDYFLDMVEKNDFFDEHLQPQWHSAFDQQGNKFVNYILKLESIEEDWEKIREKIRAKPFPKLNSSKITSENNQLSVGQKEKIYQLYNRDFKMFCFDK